MEPYVGEIRMFGGGYAPDGWEPCDGRLLPIADNEVLYSLLGTQYGGDGQSTFGVPDLRGRVAMHTGFQHPMGQKGGAETVALTQQQLAQHTHLAMAKTANGSFAAPTAHFWAGNAETPCFSTAAPNDTFNAQAIGLAGGTQPHENMMPFLALTFIIATRGVYPNPS